MNTNIITKIDDLIGGGGYNYILGTPVFRSTNYVKLRKKLEIGKTYTFSCKTTTKNFVPKGDMFIKIGVLANFLIHEVHMIANPIVKPTGNTDISYSFVFMNSLEEDINQYDMYFEWAHDVTSGQIWIEDMKIEEGNIATSFEIGSSPDLTSLLPQICPGEIWKDHVRNQTSKVYIQCWELTYDAYITDVYSSVGDINRAQLIQGAVNDAPNSLLVSNYESPMLTHEYWNWQIANGSIVITSDNTLMNRLEGADCSFIFKYSIINN